MDESHEGDDVGQLLNFDPKICKQSRMRVVRVSSLAKRFHRVYNFHDLATSKVLHRSIQSYGDKGPTAFSFAGRSNILFVEEPDRLIYSHHTVVEVAYLKKTSPNHNECESFHLKIEVEEEKELETDVPDYPCSEFGLKSECLSKQHKWNCEWIEADKGKGHNFSTCSLDKKTCPDQTCDELENLSVFAICPQDCYQEDPGKGL